MVDDARSNPYREISEHSTSLQEILMWLGNPENNNCNLTSQQWAVLDGQTADHILGVAQQFQSLLSSRRKVYFADDQGRLIQLTLGAEELSAVVIEDIANERRNILSQISYDRLTRLYQKSFEVTPYSPEAQKLLMRFPLWVHLRINECREIMETLMKPSVSGTVYSVIVRLKSGFHLSSVQLPGLKLFDGKNYDEIMKEFKTFPPNIFHSSYPRIFFIDDTGNLSVVIFGDTLDACRVQPAGEERPGIRDLLSPKAREITPSVFLAIQEMYKRLRSLIDFLSIQ